MKSIESAAKGFEAFALKEPLLAALKALGYEEPTPIQTKTIPALLEGRDAMGQAATGTGKTAAFALPILNRIDIGRRAPFEAQALVLVPTRELAMQVAEAFARYGQALGASVVAVYGGQEFHHQMKPLKRGVDVVVATPGRALDHLRRKTLKLGAVRFVVLDEADEMLDMGFAEDLDAILSQLPKERQTALFSATIPPRIAAIAERHLRDPVRVAIAPKSVEAGTLPKIRQAAFVVPRHLKETALVRVLEAEQPTRALVFCRTRVEVDELTDALTQHGYATAALHGGMSQEQRDTVLKRFKSGALKVLVATDVAARGLHVENLSHVVNFDLPNSPEPYVHRIGRTGRAGREGVALSFLEAKEARMLKNIERATKRAIPLQKVPTREELVARRDEALASMVSECIEGKEQSGLAPLVERLCAQRPAEVIAAAALALLKERLFPPHATDSVEFPTFQEAPARVQRSKAPGMPDFHRRDEAKPARRDEPQPSERWSTHGSPKHPRRAPEGEVPRGPTRPPFAHAPPPFVFGKEKSRRVATAPRGPRSKQASTWLFISLGERAGLRPQDVVGAISNEAGLNSRVIGEIEIGEESARVEVPAMEAAKVIQALSQTKLRGRKFRIDYERPGGAVGPRERGKPHSKPHSHSTRGPRQVR